MKPRFTKIVLILLHAMVCSSWSVSGLRADVADDLFTVAASHYNNRDWGLAEVELAELLRDHANYAKANDARFFLAEVYVQQNRLNQAREQYEQCIEVATEGTFAAQALFRLGEIAFRLNDLESSADAFRRFRKANPHHKLSEHASFYLAKVAAKQGDYFLAANLYREILQIYPHGVFSTNCQLELSNSLFRSGEIDEATQVL